MALIILRLFNVAFYTLLTTALLYGSANATSNLNLGGVNDFLVEIPPDLRKLAARARSSSLLLADVGERKTPPTFSQAQVRIVVPPNFDPARIWPVMVISSTSDPGFPSRKMLEAYVKQASDAGWILIAADPAENIAQENDSATLRLVLNMTAVGVLQSQWPLANKAPLAFGGFSGGAKYSGWLAAAFFNQGKKIIGVFQAGINQESLISAAKQFKIEDEKFRHIPIFLLSGENDEIATSADHRMVETEMRDNGFDKIKLETFQGRHEIYTPPLRRALEWFSTAAGNLADVN